MKKILLLFCISFSLTLITSAADKKITFDRDEVMPGKIVVKLRNDGSRDGANSFMLNSITSAYSVSSVKEALPNTRNSKVSRKLNLKNIFIMQVDESTDLEQMVNDLAGHPEIEYAEPVYKCYAEAVVDDPLYDNQPHLPQIKAPEAWDVEFGSNDVIVAIVDSGVDWDHEDLAANIWINEDEIPENGIDDDNNGFVDDIRGWDFIDQPYGISPAAGEDSMDVDNDPMDFHGHGTHCAGIAGAISDNTTGIASASGGATIMPLRIGMRTVDENGTGYASWMASAFIYAVDNGADVINLSFGNSGQLIADAAKYALLNDVLICESAGNENAITPSVLGGLDYVLSVASVDVNDIKATYSSYGQFVEISAPGGDLNAGLAGILSTVPYPSDFYGGAKYTQFQGTSMASPLVASLAALIKSHEPDLSVLELFTRIVETADDVESLNPDYVNQLGAGRINAYRALTESTIPKPNLLIPSVSINDSVGGNSNGVIDPGESFTAKFTLQNSWADASGLTASLQLLESWPLSLDISSLSIASLPGILDDENSSTVLEVPMSCSEDAIPMQVKLEFHFSATDFNQTVTVPLGIQPGVLFVADFEEQGGTELDFSEDYITALGNNRIAFDYIHHIGNVITPELLSSYKTVIWACEWNFPTVDSSDRVALKSFLDNGGSLFISGQDVGWELNDIENSSNPDQEFYENYFKTRYLADDAEVNHISGVQNDPITANMNIDFFQPYRADDEQFPDVLEPLEGSSSILNYSSGKSGAIKYDGDYRLVNFGFGGFEAVTDESIKSELMGNIVRWLSGLNLDLEPLPDTENSTDDYKVSVNLSSSQSVIANAVLYWDTDGTLPFNKVVMTASENEMYEGVIPAQTAGTEVQYFVYADDENGSNIISKTRSFKVGADTELPSIQLVSPQLRNSINVFGPSPYVFTIEASDNVGIDPDAAFVHYGVNDAPMIDQLLTFIGSDQYEGTFSFEEALNVGDEVKYFFSVEDSSSGANYAATDTFNYFIDTTQVIDDFENGLAYWDLDLFWDISSSSKSGDYSIGFEPPESAPDTLNSAITYKIPVSLSPFAFAELEFYLKATMERNVDSLFIEASNDDGATWTTILTFSKVSFSFRSNTADLTEFVGEGNDAVLIRFRAKTIKGSTSDVIWIDDVSIVVSENPVTGVEEVTNLPERFELAQNFPNPFNPATKIKFSLPVNSNVRINVFDVLGQEVLQLVDRDFKAGVHNIDFNAVNLSSGVYFYSIRIKGENQRQFFDTKKMILVK